MRYIVLKSQITYRERLRELDSFDIEIMKKMLELGPRNISNVARVMREPQQTLSYRVSKWDSKQLVVFRAVVAEEKLGLTSLHCFLRPQDPTSLTKFLRKLLLWREQGICDGALSGYYLRVTVPEKLLPELTRYLSTFGGEESLILRTTALEYANQNLDFYINAISELRKGESRVPTFDWSTWVRDLDQYPEAEVSEEVGEGRAEYDEYDLFILSKLAEDARRKFVDNARELAKEVGDSNFRKYVVLVSRRYHDRILRQNLIKKFIAIIVPNSPDLLHVITDLDFANTTVLRKFVSALSSVPYLTAYFKVLNEVRLVTRTTLPMYELKSYISALAEMRELGITRAHKLYVIPPESYRENVNLYRAYRSGVWKLLEE